MIGERSSYPEMHTQHATLPGKYCKADSSAFDSTIRHPINLNGTSLHRGFMSIKLMKS